MPTTDPRIERLRERRRAIIDKYKDRDPDARLSAEDDADFRAIADRMAELSEEVEPSHTVTEGAAAVRRAMAGADGYGQSDAHPLSFTSQALDTLQGAIEGLTAARVMADELERRAALTTATFGAPRAWGANVLDGPRLLHIAAGVPTQKVAAPFAQIPNLTLPTATGSVGENVALAEYAASTANSVTLARFGRWTDLSRESLVGADAGAITAMHRLGVALDLDKVLIDLVEAAAGAAVPFTADVPAAIRKAIAVVTAATAASDAADLVILVHPDNVALLQDVAPIGGSTMAEQFGKFSGALVYPSNAVDTGFVTVANVKSGARYFQARGLGTETELATKTSTLTVATSVIGGYGLGLTGFASKVDVVTP